MTVGRAPAEKRPGFFADILNRALGDIVEDQTPITLPETATVQAACRVMRDMRIGAILVTGEDGRLTGVFSGRDAVCRLVAEGLDPATTLLYAVMTMEPDALRPNQRASDALRMMNEGGYRHLPIVDGSRLVGIVSGGDLTAQYGLFSLPGCPALQRAVRPRDDRLEEQLATDFSFLRLNAFGLVMRQAVLARREDHRRRDVPGDIHCVMPCA
jgi:CBS domain-containing protein